MISSVLINDEGRKGMKAGGYNSPLLKGRERGERSFRRKEKWESFETLIGLGLGALSLLGRRRQATTLTGTLMDITMYLGMYSVCTVQQPGFWLLFQCDKKVLSSF